MRTHPAPLPAVDDEPSSGIVMPRLRALGFRFLHVIDAVTLFVVMHLITTARFGFDWPTFPYSHYAVGFGLATLTVHTAGSHNASVSLPGLAHETALAMREDIRAAIRRDTR